MNKQKNMLSRGYLVVFVLFILGTSVGYRLVSLQLTQGEKYRGLAEKRSIKNVEVLPVRGNIYAKDGSLLATSVSKYSIHFDAVTVSESVFQEHLSALSDSLSILQGRSKPSQSASFGCGIFGVPSPEIAKPKGLSKPIAKSLSVNCAGFSL